MQTAPRGRFQRAAWLLLLATVLVYALTGYGGLRSPDAEIVFRVGQSVAEGRGFSVDGLELYPGFGVAPGRDGKLYAIYPPLQSLVLVPAIRLAGALDRTGWYEGLNLPLSHYVDRGLMGALFGQPVSDPGAHALRFLVSFFNVIVGALGVAVLFLIARRMLGCESGALVTSILYGFGSLAWPYSGTMFTEPLATLLVLCAFLALVGLDPRLGDVTSKSPARSLALSGLALGLAVATHTLSLLFLPFFLCYAWQIRGGRRKRADALPAVAVWLAGIVVVLVFVGWYNAVRFGGPLESGRALSAINPVIFHHPWTAQFWRGLYGLFLGGGKGLLVFCPAVVVAAIGWPAFARAHAPLAAILGGAVLFRVLLVASYYDWHGGFGLGPRYLLPALPFLILPFGWWFKNRWERREWKTTAAAALVVWALLAQQFYLALGDVFHYSYMVKLRFLQQGLDVFVDDRIYLDWSLSPLTRLLEYPRGAFLLGQVPLSNGMLWGVGSLALLLCVVAGYAALIRRFRCRRPDALQ